MHESMEIVLCKLATSLISPRSHNPKVVGSNPTPATMNDEGLADAGAANPFRLPRLRPGIGLPVVSHVLALTLAVTERWGAR